MGGISDVVAMISARFSTNVQTSFSHLSAEQWIRLIVIAGAYMLLRPYIIKLGGRVQMKQHEADEKEAEEEAAAIAAGEKPALSANDLRGGASASKSLTAEIGIPDTDDDESEAEAEATVGPASGTDWGKMARKRQRRVLRKLLEVHEQKLADEQADEEDKEIQEFLVD